MSQDNPKLFGVGAVLPVHDIAATAQWYCDTLGFTLDFVMDGHGSVVRDCAGLQFTQAPPDFHAADYPGWTYLFTEHIDALHAEYQSKGVPLTRPLESHAHGMREFQIEDVNGFKLRFGQYLSE